MAVRSGAYVLAVLLVACASHAVAPARLVSRLADMPSPLLQPNDAQPRILAMHFSTLDVRRGGRWFGAIVTTTNVASVEVRTNLFSINVPHVSPGRFIFTLDVLDTPPIFVRAYRLRVIARNSAGTAYEEDVPFRVR